MSDDRDARLALADAAAEMRMRESEARLKRLRDESLHAQRQLARLFPDRAQNGTLRHAVLVVTAEVERLRAELARRDEQAAHGSDVS
jgi:hypothetical protein